MNINGVLAGYCICNHYDISQGAKEYLYYIDEKPFFVPSTLNNIKVDPKISTLNPKIVLISAPGATGKSTLARYIAFAKNAMYWDLSKLQLGENCFIGTILKAIGHARYSEFFHDINANNALLVIDALDEAEIISGRRMLGNFIADISENCSGASRPNVFLLARTETAQYVASFCAANSIPIQHYEIGFFEEESAKEFVKEKIAPESGECTKADADCVDEYFNVIKSNISQEEKHSFLGYAPVLEAISTHIKSTNNRAKMINELSTKKDCTDIILTIMSDLLHREHDNKLVPAFAMGHKSKYPKFTKWNNLYTIEEQMIRILNYILFGSIKYEDYPVDGFPTDLIADYVDALSNFIPQHPFVRTFFNANGHVEQPGFAGPAFRDFTLATLILNPLGSDYAKMYFEEADRQSSVPSQIFFDCYRSLSKDVVYSDDISYMYDSYKAKATACERPYLECTELSTDLNSETEYTTVFGMLGPREYRVANSNDNTLQLVVRDNYLSFNQVINISLTVPSLIIKIGGNPGSETRISNSTIICKRIEIKSSDVTIESFAPESCLLVSRENMVTSSHLFDVVRADNFKVSAPNISEFYRLIPYSYSFDDPSDIDATKFIHALRCILVEFRKHRKDMLAKAAERIDYVTVGGSLIKSEVLDYLKDTGIIYQESHLYKINEQRMQQRGIFFAALARMNTDIMSHVYNDFITWRSNHKTQ